MNRMLSVAKAALSVLAAGGCLVGANAVQAQETAVHVEFSDFQPAARASLPKMNDSAVFKLLLRSQTGSTASKPTRQPWIPQEPTPQRDAAFAPASFVSDDRVEQVEPLLEARFDSGPRTTGVGPLRNQQDLFSSLWGENDPVEAPHRFPFEASLVTGVPLGSPVRTIDDELYGERFTAGAVYTWSAPAFFHHPLYFEQVNLERYGQGPHHAIQPIYSAAHFFATIPKLPYHVATAPPSERVYTLGHYRPGNCAPYQWHQTRFSWKGVIVQGLATAGTAVALP